MAKQISLLLTGRLPPGDREALTQRFVSSEDVLEVIKETLQDKLSADVTMRRGLSNYSLSAWSEYQADGIGYQRALQEVLDLLTFRE